MAHSIACPATIAIVTNIDPEHMEHWGSIENLRQGFMILCQTSLFMVWLSAAPITQRYNRWWAVFRIVGL